MSDATDWRHSAVCAESKDPELFFPVGTTGPALLQIMEAKALCITCPVQPDCLDWALGNDEQTGVWGGLCEDERRRARKTAAGKG
ncbi:WhiB family transcriptional regulator [Streptomyces sp. ME02-6979.5a]|uniref:WhiB family transcriptional regulator n=1 Tax=Streptomyces sp. ME02-6979.5a TaxID=462925 RepID=UPI0029B4A479|nr:WhiB family transcriptional regulator [Streptomyces sp. ME02-6979.5a]MDX3342719.1 WhiB family transcriptional regulator [Streptomyces sp. ME02-6979.5a]